MSHISFRSVTKSFGDTTAVEDFDLEIQDGEFMVLLGPSGCGKSTALRMLAGLESITSGQIAIDNEVQNDISAAQRDIAMVFQSYALYPHMTVRKNIESPLVARKPRVSRQERDERVQQTAKILDLEAYLDRKPGELSGGQRQRVALARAIVRRPKAFLMDEPLSNLDAKLRTRTRHEIVEIWRRLGTTVIYVTHDQVEAMTMATRIAVMSMGRLQQVGTPEEVYDRPNNLFVATFIGSPPMNTLAVTDDAAESTIHNIGDLPWSAAEITGNTIGVRPEHLHLADTGIPGTVTGKEALGHETLLMVSVLDHPWIVRHLGHSSHVPGDAVHLTCSPAHLHLFAAGTGARVDT